MQEAVRATAVSIYCIMHFQENKRLKDKEDKGILKQFKRDIFDESIPIQVP